MRLGAHFCTAADVRLGLKLKFLRWGGGIEMDLLCSRGKGARVTRLRRGQSDAPTMLRFKKKKLNGIIIPKRYEFARQDLLQYYRLRVNISRPWTPPWAPDISRRENRISRLYIGT